MQPDDADRLIQDVLAELGWEEDPEAIATRVRRLDLGLPVEDQFIAVCAWLGKTRVIHKLDQHQSPSASKETFQVPDLIAHFETAGPFLVEVKSKLSGTLSFRPDYLQKLRAYADLLGMPLLIAWKRHGLWTLFDAGHLKLARTNFNIPFERALQQNLLGVLAGDVAYKIAPGAGIRFNIKKEELVGTEEEGSDLTEHWRMRIEAVTFTASGGRPAMNLDPEVATLFTTWDLEEIQVHSETNVQLSFTAGEEGMMFGHMALVHFLNWSQPAGTSINWRHAIRRPAVVSNMKNFREALERGLEQNVVHLILHQQPQAWPPSIKMPSSAG